MCSFRVARWLDGDGWNLVRPQSRRRIAFADMVGPDLGQGRRRRLEVVPQGLFDEHRILAPQELHDGDMTVGDRPPVDAGETMVMYVRRNSSSVDDPSRWHCRRCG